MPVDPSYKYLDSIEGQEYQEETLNELIHSYQKKAQKELFFKERKNEALKQSLLNNMKKDSDHG